MEIEVLPDEVLLLVLELLDERTLRWSAPRVCRRWARLAATRCAWMHVKLVFQDRNDFVERMGWKPPGALAVELRRGLRLDTEKWRTLEACAAAQPSRLSGLPLARGPDGWRRAAGVLAACWSSAEHVGLRLEPPLDGPLAAQVWAQLASMPRLRSLSLSLSPGPGGHRGWLQDAEGGAHELCWRWDEGWARLERLDLRGVAVCAVEVALWLLAGFLRVRRGQLSELLLGVCPLPPLLARPLQLRPLNLRRCARLRHLGVSCGCKDLWRLDALPQLTVLTLTGTPRKDTAQWFLESPLAARIQCLTLDGVNPSLFDVLPAVGLACRSLRALTFRHCQVPARFAELLEQCPLQWLRADNMRAEQVLEARRLPNLCRLHLSGHLGNFKSMMTAVVALRGAKPHLQVAGIQGGLFNSWGRGAHRHLATL